MDKNAVILGVCGIIVVLIGIVTYGVVNAPVYRTQSVAPDYLLNPVQTKLEHPLNLTLPIGNETYGMAALAEYDISGYLVSKRRYRKGFMHDLSPWDYALAWGQVPSQMEYLKFDQIVRFCLFSYQPGAPVDPSYIYEHMANMHLIPATENIRKALRKGRKGSSINLKGYLVNVYRNSNMTGGSVWQSSMSRSDTGNGACEVMYVNSLQIDDRVYR